MAAKDEYEDCRVYILRREDQEAWIAKAQSGDDTAKLCVNASGNFIRRIATERSVCGCCDIAFSESSRPHSFMVLIPIKEDSEKVRAHVFGVCSECSKQDNQWLIEQGPRRQGLSRAPRQPGDKLQ